MPVTTLQYARPPGTQWPGQQQPLPERGDPVGYGRPPRLAVLAVAVPVGLAMAGCASDPRTPAARTSAPVTAAPATATPRPRRRLVGPGPGTGRGPAARHRHPGHARVRAARHPVPPPARPPGPGHD